MPLPMSSSIKTKYLKSATAVCLAFYLSGCATGDLSRVEDARAATAASLPDLPSQWAMMKEKVGDVDVDWLAQLQDPILDALVAEAQKNNQSLQAIAASVDSARALSNQAASALSPQLNASLGSSSAGAVEGSGSNNLNVGVQASWEADLWGRIRSGNLAAQQSVAAAEAEYKFAQYSLAANVAKAYFVAIEANRQLDIAQKSVDTVVETNRIVQVQFNNGLADQQNVSLAKADLASAQDSLISSKAGQRDATRALELLLGRYPSAELATDKELPDLPDTPPAGIPSDLLERRPDLVAAERNVAAAFNQVDVAKAAKLPSLSLSGSLGGTSNSLSNILDPANLAWQAVASLAAPLIDGGRLDAQVDAATADQEAAVASYAQAALNAFADVEQSLDQGTVLRERKIALTTVLVESEKALNIANLQYNEGEISLLDVLTIQQRVFSARSNLLSIERASLSQFVDLNLALGGGW
ncbi:MAG: efflux transporter outer membrane subunit [Aliiglaciecola sp.]|uniref:efflux transporter outer membrane subunit n=1 Tax=Aliiglaciecola sp. M165 TaxID=2593649 RepID=UPI00117C6290|nr:efflux transporter outer membrane subunit [Aliiglaciecola sp. M165]TRY29218.1 efflux transporter outer membrane subunit [Aliiglaciecola sp. M165]